MALPHLHAELQGVKAPGLHLLLVGFADPRGELGPVDGLLLGLVGDAEAAAEVHELEADAELLRQVSDKLEEHARRLDVVVEVQLVGDDHGVQAEALHAQLLHGAVALEELLAREAVLGLLGLADDGVALLAAAPGCSGSRSARAAPRVSREELDVADVVQVDDGAERRAFAYSAAGVSLEVNMIDSPRSPTRSAMSSSGSELQSAPKPSSFMI